eukprot:scaffold685_cov281-Pinguiococcus_pyrenoidosus.AAC.3
MLNSDAQMKRHPAQWHRSSMAALYSRKRPSSMVYQPKRWRSRFCTSLVDMTSCPSLSSLGKRTAVKTAGRESTARRSSQGNTSKSSFQRHLLVKKRSLILSVS